jgi:hypothetical protein
MTALLPVIYLCTCGSQAGAHTQTPHIHAEDILAVLGPSEEGDPGPIPTEPQIREPRWSE